MKKLFALPLVALLFFTSCKKNNATGNIACNKTPSTIVAPAAEQLALQDSLTAHGIHAPKILPDFFIASLIPEQIRSRKIFAQPLPLFTEVVFLTGLVLILLHQITRLFFNFSRSFPAGRKEFLWLEKAGILIYTFHHPPVMALRMLMIHQQAK